VNITKNLIRVPLACLSFSFVVGITAIAADENGPQLLENPRLSRTPEPPRTSEAVRVSIRVDVNMTLVPVTVTDAWGRNVLGLERNNFRVLDGNEPRPIASFARWDAPISIGLIFDCSGSMATKFGIARQAPAELFEQLNPEDEAFLITVSDRPQVRNDFTANFNDILSTLLFLTPRGTTSLLDGAYLGLHHIKKAHNPRKALIVVSDGGDNHSRYKLRELTSLAAESDVQIFSICLYQDPEAEEEIEGPDLLDKLAKVSGGINYMITNADYMESCFARIGAILHNEYMLGYYPPQDLPAGEYRKIKVQVLEPACKRQLLVYARSGYFVPEK
jgi:Ca-activated chloride channel family protein